MIKINIINPDSKSLIETPSGSSLLDILRYNGARIYAPCGGKGTCGKCRVNVVGEGEIMACRYVPEDDIDVLLPGKEEAKILVSQTRYLEDLPFDENDRTLKSTRPSGIAIDIGTTTVVLYILDLQTGALEKISSFLNPQRIFGADVITRISYCQEHENGLQELKNSILSAINSEIDAFVKHTGRTPDDVEEVIVAGNTTMLHLMLGVNPISIALAPFTPVFMDQQLRNGLSSGLMVRTDAKVLTLPCISAYVGADILAGLAALKVKQKNYLFLDIGTNGEIALVKGKQIFTCATAAGPAFEGANISCGMGAVSGAISIYNGPGDYQVIGNIEPTGICGSGIVDIVAYLVDCGIVDTTGLLEKPFQVDVNSNINVIQQDVREIQLAKSAIFSGIKILMDFAELKSDDIGALYLAGGFGNYINIQSAITIGLLPHELKGRIYPVGNSAGIGALQYLKSVRFRNKSEEVLSNCTYIELSNVDEFTMEFAMNMDFTKHPR